MSQDASDSLKKWEYVSVTRNSDAYLIRDINDLGQDGWELINVYYYKNMKGAMVWTAFMKREAGIGPPPPSATTDHAVAPEPAKAQPAQTEPGSLDGFDLEGDEFGLAEDEEFKLEGEEPEAEGDEIEL